MNVGDLKEILKSLDIRLIYISKPEKYDYWKYKIILSNNVVFFLQIFINGGKIKNIKFISPYLYNIIEKKNETHISCEDIIATMKKISTELPKRR